MNLITINVTVSSGKENIYINVHVYFLGWLIKKKEEKYPIMWVVK